MMHTKEPWSTEESRVYLGRDGGFDLRDCPSPEDNSRRIVVCVNACADVPTDWLESALPGSVQNVRIERDEYLRQRDALLADAARYQWLKDRLHCADFYYGKDDPISALVFRIHRDMSVSADLDATIDAAITNAKAT